MSNLDIVSIETENLGDRSYVVGSGKSAVVIDPQRDIDRVEQILADRGWTASHVLETHFHNDYVSGGLELSKVLGAEYVVPDGMDISFSARQVNDGTQLDTGLGLIRVLHTPGHTPNHISFAVNADGQDLALFTGGSLLFGSVGRPDLLGPEMTEPLARAQWNSMRRIASEVTSSAQVYPTHGFGSFCSATATIGNSSTVAEQMRTNPAFSTSEEEFVAEIIAGLDAYPTYYRHMGPANQAGAPAIDLSLPAVVTPAEIAQRIASGEWVIDLRHRSTFAGNHVQGTLNFDVHGNAVTYLGWMIDWGTPITLLGADRDEVHTMQRELVRIGIDRPEAYAIGQPADWSSTEAPITAYPRRSHADMAVAFESTPALPMLDLRRNSEVENGFVLGAKHVPLHELRSRMAEVTTWAKSQDQPVWVYCGSGFRASIAASFLAPEGVELIHVDDDFPNAALAGLPIVTPGHGERLGEAITD